MQSATPTSHASLSGCGGSRRQLKLWVVQLNDYPRPWDQARDNAADEFFAKKIDNSGVEAYTGRME